jgi:pre-rRNA-processing protein TSR2
MAAPTLTPEQLQAKFDLGISLILSNWQALSIAVDNEWGGNDSKDKRDWFAGAVSELFTSNPDTDNQDLEDMLLQVMEDEFELALDDGSETLIAAAIIKIKDEISYRDFSTVDAMWEAFKSKKGKVKAVRVGPSSDDEDSVDDESDSDDSDEDMEDADDAAAPRLAREKVVPEVDEDGFTKVVGRRR